MTTELKQHTVKVDNYMGISYRKDYSFDNGQTVAVIAGDIVRDANEPNCFTVPGFSGQYTVGSLLSLAQRGELGLSVVA